ncbi:MAG: hypothetical protein K2Y04_12195 [Caulobacteraceae bacterium]|nr:hypothetical protein [Caulobacteraceae bacterium]
MFSVVAQALSGGGSFGRSADPVAVEAALNAAFSSSEQGSTIPRTQTINMLRELMYRTCERYLGGGYDVLELSVQAIRDQRLMVSILAIEQLTGAVTPRPVLIGASGGASAGASSDAIVRLDEARKARDQAVATYTSASTAYDGVNGEAKVCDAIKDKPESELSDEQKAKVLPCNNARNARASALADRAAKTAAYDELSALARAGGITVATGVSSSGTGGLDRAHTEAVSAVSATVRDIVERNFDDSSEVMMFCLKILSPSRALVVTPAQETSLKSVCVSYLDQSVRTAERRLAEIVRGQDIIVETGEANFTLFWSAERAAALSQQGPREALAERVKQELDPADHAKATCFASAASREVARNCFLALDLPVQRALIAAT